MPELKDIQKALDTYQVNQVQMASKEELLLMTYDIGIRACNAAAEAAKDNRTEAVHNHLLKAQDAIRELMITLNVEIGGQMAEGLMRLYDFMYGYLVEANVKKDAPMIITVKEMLEDLKSTWAEATEKLKKENQQIFEPQQRTAPKGVYAPPLQVKKPAENAPAGGMNIAF